MTRLHASVSKSAILPALARAADVADRKSTTPVLASTRLQVLVDTIAVEATSGDLWLRSTVPITKGPAHGDLCVAARELLEVVADMPADELVFTTAKDDGTWLEIQSGPSMYRLRALAPDAFPKPPSYGKARLAEVDAITLREMLAGAALAMGLDEGRPHLCGVMLEANGAAVRAVGCDGHRFHLVERVLALPVVAGGVIVPATAVRVLVGDPRRREPRRTPLLEGLASVRVALAKPPDRAFVMGADFTLAIRLVDAQFPPYEQVIPKTPPYAAEVAAPALLAATRRAMKATPTPAARGVKLTFAPGTTLELEGEHPDIAKAVERVPCEYVGAQHAVGVNPAFLGDALELLGDQAVTISMGSDALLPITLRPRDAGGAAIAVVMPMRM